MIMSAGLVAGNISKSSGGIAMSLIFPFRIFEPCMKLSKICFGLSTGILFLVGVCWGEDAPAPATHGLFATHWSRKIIYHSPQEPGYTCWVGEWIMPDKSLM